MELLSAVLTEAAKLLYNPLKTQMGYLFRYKTKVENLKQLAGDLEPMRKDFTRRIDAASKGGEVINDVATAWFNKATDLEAVAAAMAAEAEAGLSCLRGCCPDIASRYRLGKAAAKKAGEAEELLKQANTFTTVSQPAPPPSAETMLVAGDFMALSSTKEAMQKVNDALEDDDVHLIGIYGMGGVGKTTLMEEVGRRVKEENKFDVIVKVVVSQNPDVQQIRREIADKLGLRLAGDSDSAAASLATRLKKEKKALIMLDDVWARLELRSVGIPYGDEHKGCKIIITTRKHQVCQVMETEAAIMVDVLSDDDSWVLFKSKAGDVIELSDLEPIPRKVAGECGGLPLAIVVLGRALRGCTKRTVWESALMQLKRSIPTNLEGVEEQLFKCLELSYNYMKDVETKLLFLFCCLFREDYNISEDELARYVTGEGFLKDAYTLEEARGRIRLLVEDLIASCLLLGTEKEGYVKMHDVVRDVAVYIASRGEDRFFVKAGLGMREWPESENLVGCKRISLMSNDISFLPEQPNCPRLLTLLVNLNPSLCEMPCSFFVDMSALAVLDISDTNISSLPQSLASLMNLGTLRLDRCTNLRDISLVGQLKNLKVLGLQKCPINVLPEELGSLVNLKLLDLSFCTALQPPSNLLSKLWRLEELYMRSCRTNEALLIEIASLTRLVRLQLYVRDVKLFSQDIIRADAWEKLTHFIICTEFDWFVIAGVYQKNFYLKGVSHIADWAKALLKKTDDLILEACEWGSVNLVQLDEHTGFASLKKLRLTRCHLIECLLDTTQEEAVPNVLHDIEVLNLWNLENFNGICNGVLPAGSFWKLRMLDIMRCKKLVDVMPRELLLRVHQTLQEIAVKECNEPHEVFNFEGLEQRRAMLPNLRKVILHRLPNVTQIWTGPVPPGSLQNLRGMELIGCDSLASIFSQQSGSNPPESLPPRTFANLKELKIWRCRGLKHLFSASIVNELHNLERLEMKNNDAMEDIIAAENGVVIDKDAFPLLKNLLIINMPMLKSFYSGDPASLSFNWPSLRYVKLGQCQNLRRLPIGLETAPKMKKVHVAVNDDIAWFNSLDWDDPNVPLRFQIRQSSSENDSD